MLVVPSLTEGAPVVVLKAMAAGTDTAEVEARLTAERLATDWIDTPQDAP
ncbi:glycosyltransferase involved in cell wall biosynthesis [Kitasatospora sp. MAP12-15]|nr:hypothetical protein [Kitasatospora sp. MAP12-44]MDH6110117.1 glycosyltransferase involved in cell wall biosynthesis [Kitasatospora sp. MAP12-44]